MYSTANKSNGSRTVQKKPSAEFLYLIFRSVIAKLNTSVLLCHNSRYTLNNFYPNHQY